MQTTYRKMIMLAIGLLSLFASMPVRGEAAAEDDSPVVIAIAPFLDFTDLEPAAIMSLRDKVVANLLQNYNCIVLSRSNGIALSEERAMEDMSKLDTKRDADPFLPPADYSLVGYFKVARYTPGRRNQVDLGCTLLITDLYDDTEKNFRKVEFIPTEATLYTDDVTAEIAKALGLKPKDRKSELRQGKIDETWAVLPLKRLENKRAMNLPPDRDLSMVLELALQQSGKVARLVDRSQIDKALEELKISSMGAATESIAGRIANLVGADKIIMGSVSLAGKNTGNLRLDLFLVDAQSAVIAGSATVVCSKDELARKARDLVLQLTTSVSPVPEFKKSSSHLLQKEARLYWELVVAYYLSPTLFCNKIDFIAAFSEAIYLLAADDPELLHEAGDYMRAILGNLPPSSLKPRGTEEKLAKLVDKFLYKEDAAYRAGWSTRADVLNHIPGRVEEAINMAKRSLRERPYHRPDATKFYIANGYFRKKEYQKALEWARQSECYGGYGLRAELFRILDDPANDREELAVLRRIDSYLRPGSISGRSKFKAADPKLLPRMMYLLAKLEGPQAVLNYSRQMAPRHICDPFVQLSLAKAHAALGNKDVAATLLSDLDTKRSLRRSVEIISDNKSRQEHWSSLVQEIRAVQKELGITSGKNLRLSEFYKIPDKYAFYIIPLGNPDMLAIKAASRKVEDFLGCRVTILPGVALPNDPYCFNKERGRYHASKLLYRLKNNLTIPEDAIAVAFVTGEGLYDESAMFSHAKLEGGISIITYQRLIEFRNGVQENLQKLLCGAYMENADMHYCEVGLCMNSYFDYQLSSQRFSLCPLCQKKLKNRPADWVYKQMREKLKQLPTDPEQAIILAKYFAKLGEWDQALRYVEGALNADTSEVYETAAFYSAMKGDYDRTIKYASEATPAIFPHLASLLPEPLLDGMITKQTKGIVRRNQGKPLEIQCHLFSFLYQQGKKEEAAKAFMKYYDAADGYKNWALIYALVSERIGNTTERNRILRDTVIRLEASKKKLGNKFKNENKAYLSLAKSWETAIRNPSEKTEKQLLETINECRVLYSGHAKKVDMYYIMGGILESMGYKEEGLQMYIDSLEPILSRRTAFDMLMARFRNLGYDPLELIRKKIAEKNQTAQH